MAVKNSTLNRIKQKYTDNGYQGPDRYNNLIEEYCGEYARKGKNWSDNTVGNHKKALRKLFGWMKADSAEQVEDLTKHPFMHCKYPSTHHERCNEEPDFTAEEICSMDRRTIEGKIYNMARVDEEVSRFGRINAKKCLEYEKQHKNRPTVKKYFRQKMDADPELDYLEVSERDAKQITRDDLFNFFAFMRDEYTNQNTGETGITDINNYKSGIQHFFNWLSHDDYKGIRDYIDLSSGKLGDIIRSFKQKEKSRGAKKGLNYEDACKLVRNLHDPKQKAMALVLLKTGVRREELVKIKIKHINFEENYIYLPERKSYEGKIVEGDVLFDEEAKKWIKIYLEYKDADGPEDYLFTYNGGNQYAKSTITKMVPRMADKVGVKDVEGPHQLRHTFKELYKKEVAGTKAGRNIYAKIQMSHSLSDAEEEYEAEWYGPDNGIAEERRKDYNQSVPKLLRR